MKEQLEKIYPEFHMERRGKGQDTIRFDAKIEYSNDARDIFPDFFNILAFNSKPELRFLIALLSEYGYRLFDDAEGHNKLQSHPGADKILGTYREDKNTLLSKLMEYWALHYMEDRGPISIKLKDIKLVKTNGDTYRAEFKPLISWFKTETMTDWEAEEEMLKYIKYIVNNFDNVICG